MLSQTSTVRRALPLGPLLHAYTAGGPPSLAELHRLPGLGSRFAAVLAGSARFLYADFLDRANDDALRDALSRFYEAAVPLPMHTATLRRRAGFIRHALAHLLHGRESAPRKMEAWLTATGTYRVPGLGPSFWSALLQATAPARYPGWTNATRAGLDRLGLVRVASGASPASVYAALAETHTRVRAVCNDLTSLHIDHFLSLVSVMPGRDLAAGAPELASCPVELALRKLRAQVPLRRRLEQRGQALAEGQRRLAEGLASRDGQAIGEALAAGDPVGAARCALDWARLGDTLAHWLGPLWEGEEPLGALSRFWEADPLPGAGRWLPAAVLHLRDPQQFLPFNDLVRQGATHLDDGLDPGDSLVERYRLVNEAGIWMRGKLALHPLETPDLLASFARIDRPLNEGSTQQEFAGFCPDTFAFLAQLARENRRSWMDVARERYHFGVRGPLTELCRALAQRYVEPILGGMHGWRLDTDTRTGKALTSVCRNVFGRSLPYTSTLWITFCRPDEARKGAQLFVRLSPEGLRFGLRLGRTARAARERLRAGIDHHAETVFRLLQSNGALAGCLFGPADAADQPLDDPEGLRAWGAGRSMEVSRRLDPAETVQEGEGLVETIVQVFDQLVPLFACCADEDAGPALARLGGTVPSEGYSACEFHRQTYLSEAWLERTLELLALKKQLILQGVPGTGKTHVARALARLLTSGRDEAVRLVQFHPAYSYEEFVEGIRVRSVQHEGRHDVTYPVEDGLLCSFAARAAARPAQPHVLIVDEINRGNLPRIFGELLYLLEYRGQAVELPYSRREFHLPANLYLVGTMNGADRSIALIDQALRRRFSFVQMDPDIGVLSAWLRAHPPKGGPAFVTRVTTLFERLNARLRAELGPQAAMGHSYFMLPGLDEERLRMIWQHHLRPQLDELFAGQPGRATAFDTLLEPASGRTRRSEPVSPT